MSFQPDDPTPPHPREVQVVLYYEGRAIHRSAGLVIGPDCIAICIPYPPLALNSYVEMALSTGGPPARCSPGQRFPAVVARVTRERIELSLECPLGEVGLAQDGVPAGARQHA